MDWIPTLIAAIAAGVSVWGAWQSTTDTRRRAAGRRAIAEAMDLGNRLLEELRARPGANVDLRVEFFHKLGHTAVDKADRAQLPRYNAPLQGKTHAQVITERLERLQSIQDSLH